MAKLIQTDAKKVLEEAKKVYAKRGEELRKLKKPHARIAAFLDRWVQLNFRTEGGRVGGWVPFTYGGRVTTKKKSNAVSLLGLSQKKKGGATQGKIYVDGSAKLLQDTGRLRLSFLPFASFFNAGVGSDLKYSKAHEEGSRFVPQRRILPLHSEVKDDIRKFYDDHVKNSIDD